MEADFRGYASKAELKCSDGRTIAPNAFQHQDAMRVPLVWQHNHTDVENVLGHAILENREDGVYAYGFFNETPKGQHAKNLVVHGDINALSIWANGLAQKASRVVHGMIREVSLVLSGANPGALIESVRIAHSGGVIEELEDEVIIHSGELIEVLTGDDELDPEDDPDLDPDLQHAAGDQTIEEVFNSLTPVQMDVVHYLIGTALDEANANGDPAAAHSNLTLQEGTTQVTNVFEGQKSGEGRKRHVLSHDNMKKLLEDGNRLGSLRKAVEEYAGELSHGITDIDQLFPDAKLVGDAPEWVKRNTGWVPEWLAAVNKRPFSRIKTMSADITEEAARAKGYITGNMKKEEFFSVARRVTTPTTIYKKQALDRDDMIDITDFDIIAWLKFEMRLMLDEELARAMLMGDGRDPSDEDKIPEGNIRPVISDHEAYVTTVNVNVNDANSDMLEVMDALLDNRYKLKGTGLPNFYTTEIWLAKFLKIREADSKRRMYRNADDLATEMRVARIITVEPLQEAPNVIGILVNPVDYVLGADKGGEVSMFDDFDIDYNKQKYLIETRCSGALNKLKSAMVLVSVASTAVLIVPAAPTFNNATGVITIPTQTGVVYKNAGGTTLSAGAQSPIAIGARYEVFAFVTNAANYYFADSDTDNWDFTRSAT